MQGADGVGVGVGGVGVGAVPVAACVTVTVCPATVTLPLRASPVFARTVKAALPLPVPDAVVVSIQGTPLVAVHPHPAALALTAIDSVPPVADIEALAEAIVNLHTAASCDTTTCASLTPTIALRGVGSALAATW